MIVGQTEVIWAFVHTVVNGLYCMKFNIVDVDQRDSIEKPICTGPNCKRVKLLNKSIKTLKTEVKIALDQHNEDLATISRLKKMVNQEQNYES